MTKLKQTLQLRLQTVKRTFLFMLASLTIFAYSEDPITRHVPYLPSSADSFNGVLRLINHSSETGEVSIVGIDEAGDSFGPATLKIKANENLLIYATELENGDKEVATGLGRGEGSWRLSVTSELNIETIAYFEATDGLLTSLGDTVRGENGCWRIPTFYAADNLGTAKLRLTNAGSSDASVKISGRDDNGVVSAKVVELSIPSQVTRTLSLTELENGSSDIGGSLGNGSGNWQLAIESDLPVTVMNILEGARRLSNMSDRPSYSVGHCWLGKTLANADRSIGKNLETFVEPIEGADAPTPAIYAAIVDETGVRAVAALGIKKAGSKELATVNDKLYLSSNTKPMTATMIATLVDAKIFPNGWDTTVSDVFGNLLNQIHTDYHEVTIRDLLVHEGGVPYTIADWEDFDPDLNIVERRKKAMLATLSVRESSSPQRGALSFSHAGYMIAGAMAEKLTGQSWEALMLEWLFEPLGMSSAGFGPPGTPREVDEPWGHTVGENGTWEPSQDDVSDVLHPSGGVHVSIEDWAKFVQLWMIGKQPAILDRAKLHELTRLAVDQDGNLISPEGRAAHSAGWWVYESLFGYGETMYQLGTNQRWFTLSFVMRDINRAYLVVTNSVLPPLPPPLSSIPTYAYILYPAFTSMATSPARSMPPKLTASHPN